MVTEGGQTQMCLWPDLSAAHVRLWLYLIAVSNANLETAEPFSGLLPVGAAALVVSIKVFDRVKIYRKY